MKQKDIYTGIVLIMLLVVGALYAAAQKKPAHAPVQITWLPASTLAQSWSNGAGTTWFSMQNGTIDCMRNPISGVDASTFVVSSLGDYGKDKTHVYWCSEIVADADPASFEVINGEYAKDASHVYWEGYYTLPDADPATFSIVPAAGSDNMQTGYGKDKTYVYNLYRKLPGADPATFTLDPVPHDKNLIYQNSDVVGPASLITDNAQYAKALPVACNPLVEQPIYPQAYPPAFSASGSVIGYPNDNAICVIDKAADTIKIFPYGTQQGVSISKDGTKILYFIYQKGDGEGEQTCADCGQYSLDRATGKVEKIL